MRQRFHVAHLGTDFPHALEVKKVFQEQHPDIEFQIKRRAKDTFELVKRLSVKDAVKETQKLDQYSKKRKRKRIH